MITLDNILIFVCCYLMGSFNFAIIISKYIFKLDIRTVGSKNAGTTNMLRTFGKRAALTVLLLDFIRGYLITRFFGAIGAIAVCYGQMFPIFFHFKGGKGVATTLGVIFATSLKLGFIITTTGIAIIAITGFVSLSSILGAVTFIILGFIKGNAVGLWALFISLPIIYGHRENIKRLLNHTENRLSMRSK